MHVSCLKVLSASAPFVVSNLPEQDLGQSAYSLSKALQYVSESRYAQAPSDWPSSAETLTDALASLGIGHGPCKANGRKQLFTPEGDAVGAPVHASTAWVLVHLVRTEAHPLTSALIDRALALDVNSTL